MHNPFQLFSNHLLDALMKAGHKYFVRQTYKRGLNHFDETQKGAYLFSHYQELIPAKVHMEAIKNDGNKFLYDVSEPVHMERLKTAAGQPEGYKIFSPLLLEPWKPHDSMAGKVRRYIDTKLQWRPGRDDTVRTNLSIQYGELFITLKMGIHEVKIPLSDIERL